LSSAPVIYGDKVLFNIYAGLDDFSAHERAVVISKRLKDLAEAVSLTQDSLHIQIEESRRHILYADKLIMIIADADTIALKEDADEIAGAYHSLISERFIQLFISYSFKDNIFSIIKTILLAGLVIALAIVLFRLLARLMDMLKRLVARFKKEYSLGIVVRGFRILTAEQFDKTLSFLISLTNLILIIILSYFALYFLLLCDSLHTLYSSSTSGIYHAPHRRGRTSHLALCAKSLIYCGSDLRISLCIKVLTLFLRRSRERKHPFQELLSRVGRFHLSAGEVSHPFLRRRHHLPLSAGLGFSGFPRHLNLRWRLGFIGFVQRDFEHHRRDNSHLYARFSHR